jgi:hypothetical protein
MASSSDREQGANKETRLYAEHKAGKEYLASFKTASFSGFPRHYAEESEIQAGRDYSTWILSASDCDRFMRALLNTPSPEEGARVSFFRHKKGSR